MDFDLSENQQLFRASVARFCGPFDHPARKAARSLPGGIDRARWRELADLGLIALAAAEADGGLGGSLADCAVVAQSLGEGLAGLPWIECGYLPARLLAGHPALAQVIAGEQLASFAWAEPGRRHNVNPAMASDGERLSGTKTFAAGGGAADLFVVSALHQGRPALFAIEAESPGLTVERYWLADGTQAAELHFDAVAHGAPLAADPGAAIDGARLLAAAELTGLARRLFADTLAYAKTREQFGQPIGRFQVIQHRLVDCHAKIEAMQSALYRALLLPGAPVESVKGFIAEQAIWVGQQAVQLHGGMGMTDELAIGHALKRVQLLARLLGDPAEGIAALARQEAA